MIGHAAHMCHNSSLLTFPSKPPEPPLGPLLLWYMHEVTPKTCKLGQMFNVLPIVCGVSVFVFVLACITLCPF